MGAIMDFLVNRENLREGKFDTDAPAPLRDGQVRLAIEKFAFTANNVTYGAVGELVGYWNFFPAEPGWGRIPVWGIAAVDESKHPDVPEGERIYGYLPMSTELVIEPGGVSAHGLVDASAHRAALPPVYNQYTRLAAQPGYDRAHDDRMMLLQPLFTTSFLIDDFLDDNDFFGAKTVVVLSASSKTAFSLAYLLSKNRDCDVVGLTSKKNAAFVAGLGCYGRTVAYPDLAGIPKGDVVLVDMAGSAEVLRAAHEHFGEGVKYSCQVGITHWEEQGGVEGLPGAKPQFFFAPTQVEKRRGDWGAAGFQQRVRDSWGDFLSGTDGWLEIVHGRGPDAVERVYRDTLEGRVPPSQGHVLSLG